MVETAQGEPPDAPILETEAPAKRPREALSANHYGPVNDSLWPVLSIQRHTLVLPFDGIKEDAKGTLRRDPGSAF